MSYAKYIGKGRFFSGVPTRDLSKDEWEILPEETRSALLAQQVFEIYKPAKHEKKEE